MQKIDLNTTFSEFLTGKDFLSWANFVTERVVFESGQKDHPFHLAKIFPLLKIKDVSFIHSTINGYVQVEKDGFKIYLSDKFKINNSSINYKYINQVARFKLAHEIAHLFFFDINTSPPRQLINLPQGDATLEHACNVLARCLILPKTLITQSVLTFLEKRKKSIYPTDYNLFYMILGLIDKFDASWYNILTRIFDDLRLLPNSIFMEFNILSNGDKINNTGYRLKSLKISENLTSNGLFIPYPYSERTPISAKGVLLELIRFVDSTLEKSIKPGDQIIQIKENSFSGFGNLGKFIEKKLFNENKPSLPLFYLKGKGSISIMFCLDDVRSEGQTKHL